MNAPANPSRRRARKIAFWVVGVIAGYGIVGGLLLPPLAKRVLADKLGERLGRVVAIDALSANPYTLNATVRGMRILEPDGRTTFASFDQLDLDGSIESLYRFAPVFDQATLSGLQVDLVRDGEAHYNVSDIIPRLAQAHEAGKSVRKAEFSVANIRITNGRIRFDDRPKGKKHEVSEIDVAIPLVSSLPTHLKEFVQPKFSAKVNGTAVRLEGETLPFEDSLRTHLAINLDSMDVPPYVAYSPTALPVKVDAAKLDARLSVRFTQTKGKQPSIDVSGTIALREVGLSVPDDGAGLAKFARVDLDIASLDPLAGLVHVNSLRVTDASANQDEWRVPAAEARDIRIDISKKNVRIESVSTRDGVLAVKRRQDGSIEMPFGAAKAEAPAAEASTPWVLALGSATIDGYKVALADASVKPAATHRVGIAHAEVRDVSTEKGAKSSVTAKLATDKGGALDLEATFGISPLALDARVDARRIDLVAFRPYVTQFATVGLKSARASAKGTLTLAGAGDAMRIGYTGAADVSQLATVDTVVREDLLNWDSVRLTGVAFQSSRSEPVSLTVAEIAVNKAYARVVVTPEGKINLQQLKSATPEEPDAPPVQDPKPRNVRIDRVTFADSRLDFSDHFIRPNYSADVGGLSGSITNLSSDPASRGVVDLKGSYDATSPVVIAGTINPLSGNLFLDIAAKGSDIELPKLTAYSQRYAGYGITAGKLTLDVKYHVEDGKLAARNKIRLDQLTFGDKVESPDATKLPVIFAVNLLKDSNGVIDVDLPIAGSLEDPQFNIGGLIVQVVGSLFKKAITAPFSLLTAALGGSGGNGGNGGNGASGAAAAGGEDLAFVQFEAGRDEIGAAGEKKLDTVGKALADRPAIRIEMASRTDAEKDLAALKRAALLAKVKAAAGGAEIAFDGAEYPRYLKAALEREKIPRPAPAAAAKEGSKESKDAAPKELTVAEMEALLLGRIQVGDEELKALAQRRADRVKSYLTGKGQLPAERILVAAADTAATGKDQQSRVEFTLR